ncbi:hypothetical protein HOD05_05480 [Candidatus Woesearchaeota archaeon]|jgi:hypothetical protein|nr:hypothetical protein [Candidatus Woesearchaeota archaeon]MBT4150499.1 hypothetical protein [Candidatus Woesearchaeota archaeon]MBT4247139.1 hypothetical protein [Candidatus Woesearchaeota archaeon]MBT4434635.1 hypothetical protein [Candidatus Woesearchaeota archaeon]MBT7332609.1 hypothetical protein [Candidatus Woesearchaeota archaeon]
MPIDEIVITAEDQRKLDAFPDVEKLLANAEPCTIIRDAARSLQVASWKEIYSRSYLVPNLVTSEEYDSVPASTERRDSFNDAQQTAWLMTQPVGSEEEMPKDWYKVE